MGNGEAETTKKPSLNRSSKERRDLCGIVDKIQRIPTVPNAENGALLFTYYAYTPKPGSPYKCDAIGLS